jgi:hypothetical protein
MDEPKRLRAMIVPVNCIVGAAKLTGFLSKMQVEELRESCTKTGHEIRAFAVDRDGRAL